MIKRSFIGLTKPMLKYEALDVRTPEPTIIQEPKKVSLFLDKTYGFKDSILFKIGDKVKTGQKLSFSENSDAYVISSVTGKISSIETLTGDYGKTFTSVSIDVDDNEEIDDQFKTLAAEPTLDSANNFLSGIPGKPSFKFFSDPEKPINTIIVNGIDRDLLVAHKPVCC